MSEEEAKYRANHDGSGTGGLNSSEAPQEAVRGERWRGDRSKALWS